VVTVPDLLIRSVDEDTLRRIDADAERLGLSRTEYLRREIVRLGQRGTRPTTREDLTRAMKVFADLSDDAVMSRAWS
jgi:Ribbon-helix-helix protein, copG family.